MMENMEIAQETTETPYIPEESESAADAAEGEAGDGAAEEQDETLESMLEKLITEDPAEADAEDEAGGEAGEKKQFSPQIDFAGVLLSAANTAKKEMRESQLKGEGVEAGLAGYVATIELVNKQYRDDRDALRGDANLVAETAGILGLPAADMMAQIRGWAMDAAAGDRAQVYTSRGYDADVAKEMALKDIKVEVAEKAARQKQAGRTGGDAFMAEVRKMREAYPETETMAVLPPEVIEAFNNGMTPLEAYQGHKLRQAESTAMAAQGARRAAQKSTGGATSQKDEDDLDVAAIFTANYGKY